MTPLRQRGKEIKRRKFHAYSHNAPCIDMARNAKPNGTANAVRWPVL
ncbi:hypothetical protein [Pandoraea faecigallinarum]|nr:hypothetical protein [Pandoraea faecigallinarum]